MLEKFIGIIIYLIKYVMEKQKFYLLPPVIEKIDKNWRLKISSYVDYVRNLLFKTKIPFLDEMWNPTWKYYSDEWSLWHCLRYKIYGYYGYERDYIEHYNNALRPKTLLEFLVWYTDRWWVTGHLSENVYFNTQIDNAWIVEICTLETRELLSDFDYMFCEDENTKKSSWKLLISSSEIEIFAVIAANWLNNEQIRIEWTDPYILEKEQFKWIK